MAPRDGHWPHDESDRARRVSGSQLWSGGGDNDSATPATGHGFAALHRCSGLKKVIDGKHEEDIRQHHQLRRAIRVGDADVLEKAPVAMWIKSRDLSSSYTE